MARGSVRTQVSWLAPTTGRAPSLGWCCLSVGGEKREREEEREEREKGVCQRQPPPSFLFREPSGFRTRLDGKN
jgi:hypothetical protein